MTTMLDCKKIQASLSEYVDGALTTDAAWNVKLHLSSCAVCAQIAQELSATAALLSFLPRPELSAGFDEALTRRLADQALQPRRPGLLARLRMAWEGNPARPQLRTVLAATGALAVLAPTLLVALRSQNGAAPEQQAAAPIAAPIAAAQVAEQHFLRQVLEEHASYASSEPLGDQAAVILASTGASQ